MTSLHAYQTETHLLHLVVSVGVVTAVWFLARMLDTWHDNQDQGDQGGWDHNGPVVDEHDYRLTA